MRRGVTQHELRRVRTKCRTLNQIIEKHQGFSEDLHYIYNLVSSRINSRYSDDYCHDIKRSHKEDLLND